MSINWRMHKQNVVYAYNRIFFYCKKKRGTDTCYDMNERSQTYTVWFRLYEINVQSGKSIETESRLVVPQALE